MCLLFGSERIQTSYRGLETSSLAGLAPGYHRCICNRLLDHSYFIQYLTPEWKPGYMETILEFASVSLKKIETDLLGSLWPCQCVLPIETRLEPRPRLKPDEWEL